jgi:beta-phosphoglucomutase
MFWLDHFQLFLFDMDGLLVNTEEIHFQAYKRALLKRRIALDWDFKKYCSLAHYTSDGVKKQVSAEYPQLQSSGCWESIYADKTQAMLDLLHAGAIQPMPGVVDFLTKLENRSIPRCVVTHSSDALVEIIRQKNPILNTIPFWITRRDYSKPKPDAECYLKAITTYANPHDNIVGFEDTPRGLQALMQTPAKAVLISEIPYPEIPTFLSKGALHFPTLAAALQGLLKPAKTSAG